MVKKISSYSLNFSKDITKYFVECWGDNTHKDICKSLCEPPTTSTIRINLLGLKKYLNNQNLVNINDVNSNDDKWLQKRAMDILRTVIPKEYKLEAHPIFKDCITSSVTGPFPVSVEKKFVVVDRKCGEAVLRGSHIFAPGILGISKTVSLNDKISILCDIESKTKRGTKFNEIDDATCAFYLVANGYLKMDRKSIFHLNKGLAVEIDECIWKSIPLSSYLQQFSSIFFLQNFPSMCAVHLLDPKPGETILDMCAAPGGKTTHIASLMKNMGKVLAFDRNKCKVDQLIELCNLMDLTIVDPKKANSTQLVKKSICQPLSFDRILLDGPCSGLGQRPNFGHDRISMSELIEMSNFQKKFLREASQLVKPNGYIVYSTCTINPMENEENVMWFLKNYGDSFILDELPPIFQHTNFNYATPGLLSIMKNKDLCNKVLLFLPCHNVESIGFFIARFKRVK